MILQRSVAREFGKVSTTGMSGVALASRRWLERDGREMKVWWWMAGLGSDELTSRKLNGRDWALWVKSKPALLRCGKGLGCGSGGKHDGISLRLRNFLNEMQFLAS